MITSPFVRISVPFSPNISILCPNVRIFISEYPYPYLRISVSYVRIVRIFISEYPYPYLRIYKNDTLISARFLAAWLRHPHCTAGRVGLCIPSSLGLPPLRCRASCTAWCCTRTGPSLRASTSAPGAPHPLRNTPSAVHSAPYTAHPTPHTLHYKPCTVRPRNLHPPRYHGTPCTLETPNRTVANRNKSGLGSESCGRATEAAERV